VDDHAVGLHGDTGEKAPHVGRRRLEVAGKGLLYAGYVTERGVVRLQDFAKARESGVERRPGTRRPAEYSRGECPQVHTCSTRCPGAIACSDACRPAGA
jgi:hypothetical protein